MTTILLQKLQVDEGSVVTFDATSRNRNPGLTSGFSIFSAMRFGTLDPDVQWITQAGFPGGRQGDYTEGVGTMTFRLHLLATSYEDEMAQVRALVTALSSAGVWLWQPDGAAEPRYVDAYRSPVPSPLQGGDLDLDWLARRAKAPQGLEVTLWHNPWVRGPRVTLVTALSMANQVGSAVLSGTNPGNRPALARVTVAPDVGTDPMVMLRAGVRSVGNLTEHATLAEIEAETATSLDSSVTIPGHDGSFSGSANNYVHIAYGTDVGLLIARFTCNVSPTDETALDGTHRLYAVIRPSHGAVHTMRIVQGLTPSSGPAPYPNDLQTVDTTDWTSDKITEVDLGLVTYDQIGSALVLEWQSAADTSGATLDVDMFKLVPADEQFVEVFEPGLRVTQTQREFGPAEFVNPTHMNRPSRKQAGDPGFVAEDDGAGTWSGNTYGDTRAVFGNAAIVGGGQQHPNKTDEAVTVGPAIGMLLPAGRYNVVFSVTLQENDQDVFLIGEGRIRQVSGTPHDVAKVKLESQAGHGSYSTPLKNSVSFDADGVNRYQPQAVFVADREPTTGAARRKMSTAKIAWTFTRSVSEGDGLAFVVDGFNERAYAQVLGAPTAGSITPGGSADHFLRALQYLVAPPGDFNLVLDFGSLPDVEMAGYIDQRGNPYPLIDVRDAYLVTLEIWPRYAPF